MYIYIYILGVAPSLSNSGKRRFLGIPYILVTPGRGPMCKSIRHWNTMQTSSSFQRNMLTLRCNSWHQLWKISGKLFWGEEIGRVPPFFWGVKNEFSGSCDWRFTFVSSLSKAWGIDGEWYHRFTKPKANRGSGPESTSRKPQGASDKVPRGKKPSKREIMNI